VSQISRSVLPIPDQPHVGLTTYDAKDPATSFPPIRDVRPPAGAPNVLVVLLDDVGFAASSAFGGPINTPTAERLAASGLKYNRFHTTALCSPTRAALLSGRNHHVVGMGGITEIATSAPGLQLAATQHLRPARRDAQAQRLLDRSVRQVPRGPGVADEPDGARSTTGRPVVAGSSTSTGSSAARRTSTRRRSTTTRRPSSPSRRPMRATTSPRT
jgi:hypothetical protein